MTDTTEAAGEHRRMVAASDYWKEEHAGGQVDT